MYARHDRVLEAGPKTSNSTRASPAGGYRDYLMTELQGIGAGIDVPYELCPGDLSNVNYSSYRAGMLGFRNAIEAFRVVDADPDVLPTDVAQVHRHTGVHRKDSRGELTACSGPRPSSNRSIAEGCHGRVETHPHRHVDPLGGHRPERLRPEKQLQEIKRMNELLDELQIILDCDPRAR